MLQVKFILKLKFFTYNVVDSQFLACLLALVIIHEIRAKGQRKLRINLDKKIST